MNDADLKPFAQMLAAVASIYGRELSRDVIGLYFRALREYDLAVIRDGLDRHVRNPDSGQWFPKPADVIRMAGGSSLDAALLAWGTVERAIAHVGGYVSVAFTDPVAMRVLSDMGGWIRLCDMTSARLEAEQREFVLRYRTFVSRSELAPAAPRYLPGRIEAANGEQFADANPPIVRIESDGAIHRPAQLPVEKARLTC